MKIKTKLQLLFIFLILAFVGLVLIFQYSFAKSEAENDKHEVMMNIKDNIYNLGLSMYEYSLEHNLEIRHKWNSIHGLILEDIRSLSLIDKSVESLLASYIELDDLFEQLLEVEERELYDLNKDNFEEVKAINLSEEQLFNQILVKSQALFDRATLLTENSHKEIITNNQNNRKYVMSFVSVVGLILLIFLYCIFRNISKSLKKLIDGIKIVGAGGLEYEIQNNSKDEIGQITSSFNQMTKQLYETKSSIEKLVKERTGELEKINDYMVGREIKMIELKKEINELKNKSV